LKTMEPLGYRVGLDMHSSLIMRPATISTTTTATTCVATAGARMM